MGQNYLDPACVESEDELINLKVPLQLNGETKEGTVIRRKRNHDGSLVETKHKQPKLDLRIYEVKIKDGIYAEYSTNVLFENLYSQIDQEGHNFTYFDEIIELECTLCGTNSCYSWA